VIPFTQIPSQSFLSDSLIEMCFIRVTHYNIDLVVGDKH